MSSGRIASPIVTALVLVAGGVRAEALYPIQGKAIDLGTIDGDARRRYRHRQPR
jgi:hypothetical protein